MAEISTIKLPSGETYDIKDATARRNISNITYGVATQKTNGLMSSTDKTKLDSLSTTSVSAITNTEIDTIVAS